MLNILAEFAEHAPAIDAPPHRCDPDEYSRRYKMIERFGFSIPTASAVAFVAKHVSGSLLEVGAGSGYWSKLFADAGLDVVATDPGGNYSFSIGVHYQVRRHSAFQAVKLWHDRPVFMSWPCYNKRWAEYTARALDPGRLLFYVGEHDGGCCANAAFFRVLDERFERIDAHPLPTWSGMHDHDILLYRKLRCTRS